MARRSAGARLPAGSGNRPVSLCTTLALETSSRSTEEGTHVAVDNGECPGRDGVEVDTWTVDKRTDEQLIEIVERFVLRARRIFAYSLCADEVGLANLADGAWYSTRKGGIESISRLLPNEEVLESLAARVRPLLLQDDGVHYNAVLNALSSLLIRSGRPEDAGWCKELKKSWQSSTSRVERPGTSAR